jgi:hypothetical protein
MQIKITTAVSIETKTFLTISMGGLQLFITFSWDRGMVTSHCGLYTNKAGALEIITEFSV